MLAIVQQWNSWLTWSWGALEHEWKGRIRPEHSSEVISEFATSAPMFSLKGPSMVKAAYPTAFPLKHQQNVVGPGIMHSMHAKEVGFRVHITPLYGDAPFPPRRSSREGEKSKAAIWEKSDDAHARTTNHGIRQVSVEIEGPH
ncbi:hypothetical protein EJB05_03911 [Eragrostis curvula]|uniref:Uncharacterized protein n=1 Tax=Eragrostis curvula TaxID=38414 RepID=A0A5J9W8K4_9POAL|nr:hypothetical protein EJB05_03911 [Eragrostis curvula]